MAPPTATEQDYSRAEETMLAVGLGLVLIGAGVIGFFETVFGSAHVSHQIAGITVIFHTSFNPHLRAYTIALGFVVLFIWGVSRGARSLRN